MNIILFGIIVVLIVAFGMYRRSLTEQNLSVIEEPNLPQKQKCKVRLFMSNYTAASVRARPESLFLYEDNTNHAGERGQAVIRHEPNTCGIVTKIHPYNSNSDFMSDDEYDNNTALIDESFDLLYKKLSYKNSTGEYYKVVYIPVAGLGTQLPTRAPKTFTYLLGKLYDMASDLDPEGFDTIFRWISEQKKID